MANDPLAVSDFRAETPETARRDMIELAAAIDRIRVAIGIGAVEPADGLAAAERIKGIGRLLRERGADAALCDGLDAAVQEISEVLERNIVGGDVVGRDALERGSDAAEPLGAAPVQRGPPTVADHPLAALRALSAEELIALFT